MTETITVLRHPTLRMAKVWSADGDTTPYDEAKVFKLREVEVDGLAGLSALLKDLERDVHSCIIRGKYVGDDVAKDRDPEATKGKVLRRKAVFDERPLHMLLIDVDRFEPLSCDPVLHPELAIREYVAECLPEAFADVSCHWQLSNSAGLAKNSGVLKAHLWWWLRDPLDGDTLTAWAQAGGHQVDVALFRTVQIHYTALPVMGDGVVDPVPVRSGFLWGLAGDEVPLVVGDDVHHLAAEARALAGVGAGGRGGGRHEVMRALATDDPVVRRLRELDLLLGQVPDGAFNIKCPFVHLHTDGAGGSETATQYMPRNTRGFAKGNFKCMHAHCSGRERRVWLGALGIFEDLDGVEDAFGVVEDGSAGVVRVVGVAGADNSSPAPLDMKGIPEAKHLCTDQANAGRIVRRHGKRVFVAAGRWHSWDGRRWVPDESNVYRWACELSRMVHAEASAMRAKVGLDVSANAKLKHVAEALDKWAIKCEMKGVIESAVGLARKMLTVDGNVLDRDPWLLNVRNGTIDLRTGELRPHKADDYITRLADVEYDPGAKAPLWEETLGRVTLEDGLGGSRPMVSFLQRWFGYCATGLTREQQFVVHYGSGSNGKSTVLDVVAEVLGDYAGTAAPGLLMNGGRDRHPTEIADLFGRRMVTAHETGDGGVLREDFVKQATGGDRIKARFMHADFFEFSPTHKLQLLTNHKPIIKGQDVGIWRRVLLMPYLARFGGVEDVRAGRAHYAKDVRVMDRLLGERAGVLAWVVRGAVEWATAGLQPPETVLAASRDYQTEQDRIGQFLVECCELGVGLSEPLTAGMHAGLYSAYTDWSKEGGTMPLSKNRFLAEVTRAVPGAYVQERKTAMDGGRRLLRYVFGVRLLQGD